MHNSIEKLMDSGCNRHSKDKICRAKGGESCAFDGAMIVLAPIADSAHIVHGPIACLGNSWEGRGSLSKQGNLHKMGFTTKMNEMDIVYGSEEKLYKAILQVYETVKPKAVFVYATCVSGLTGEDIESVAARAENTLGIRVIPVNAPGFTGPKNLGNRIAGEALLDYVIGTGTAHDIGEFNINLIGEYNIAGDLWLIEPLLKEAGINILSRISGDSRFEEITYAHQSLLNVVVCSRALINVAKEMKNKYGIPYIEASFFGKTEMSKALTAIADGLGNAAIKDKINTIIEREQDVLTEKLKAYELCRGLRAVLYTGGVKSWSFISALMDLGIEVTAIGTKKSTFEDEEKMKEILGEDAPLVSDVTPKNLLKLIRDNKADILVAGGRNQYLGVKEGIPFVDVNQERHTAYAGYEGLVNLAKDISESVRFYSVRSRVIPNILKMSKDVVINPIRHSQSIGAAMALQGIDRAIPIIHGAQGCSFLQKVLLTKHFREPIALHSTKMFTEDVVMGSEECLERTINEIIEKNKPDLIGVLTSGLTEIKGDDAGRIVKNYGNVVHIPTPDYVGGIESGYCSAVKAVLRLAEIRNTGVFNNSINVLAGSHLNPADFTVLSEMIKTFGLTPIILPDLSSLDGSRKGISPLSLGGVGIEQIKEMGGAIFTLVIGASLESAAVYLKEVFDIEYKVFAGVSGLKDTDMFLDTLSMLSGNPVPLRYIRQRSILIDGLGDAHFYMRGKKVCMALEPDLSIQSSRWLDEAGAEVILSVIPTDSPAALDIMARDVIVGDLTSIEGDFDILLSNSHAKCTAQRLGIPLYQIGFPVYKSFGYCSRVTIGYVGAHLHIIELVNKDLCATKEEQK
ncbi:MAG: nitrogenase iron-molybdenum cofactor biosynthesis protein NifE [Nitrospirae bacterium]|nr:nitrogenase iron-molybdenum cofactor biosynthesis protein NifE [Nitrospirota bacterium]